MTRKRRTPALEFVRAHLDALGVGCRLGVWIGLSHGRGFLPRRIKVATRSKYWHVKVRIGTGSSIDLVYEASWGTGVASSFARDHKPSGTDWFPVRAVSTLAAIRLAAWCEHRLGRGYDWWSGLRFLPIVRGFVGDREGRHQVRRFNCSKFGLKALRAIDLEPIPRMPAFRCAPGHFLHSALLADPVNLDAPILLHEVD
jgi:hypothetical protein